MPGSFTATPGDEVNQRPVYRQVGGTAYFAVSSPPEGQQAVWVGSNTAVGTRPGDQGGLIVEGDYLNPKVGVEVWTDRPSKLNQSCRNYRP